MLHDALIRRLPPPLAQLVDWAFDLRCTGELTPIGIWRALDAETWERTENPYLILMNAHSEKLEAVARDPERLQELDRCAQRRAHYLYATPWFGSNPDHRQLANVAYFSMEFGLCESLPIYSGGLGMLAGDHLRAASDLGVPLVGIGLLYQQGYFRQGLGWDARQTEAFPYNDPTGLPVRPLQGADGHWLRVRLPLPGRTLLARAWEVRVGRVRLLLLDSNDPCNTPEDRAITANLYDAGHDRRFLQEVLLGVGGWQLVKKLDLDVDVCHLNEGHAALLVPARAASLAAELEIPFEVALRATRPGNVFTTHTPVEAAFDRFDPDYVAYTLRALFDGAVDPSALVAMGRKRPDDPGEPFNMAYLAIRGCSRVNAVSRLHGEVSRRLFADLFEGWPLREVPVTHITNGVARGTWVGESAERRAAWTPSTASTTAAQAEPDSLSDQALWRFRSARRTALIGYVRRRLARQLRERGAGDDAVERASRVLDPSFLTLGFARRFTAYKRPTLLLHDADRLARILGASARPVQLIVAGKAHPHDGEGKQMVQAMARFATRADVSPHVVFLTDYDMVLAQHLVSGVDVWLNHPRRPAEACGTSGMKILANGGLHFSTLDGWWDEAYSPDVGWALGDAVERGPEHDPVDADQLYTLLESEIVPEFYERDAAGIPGRWLERVRASMDRLTPAFSSARMVRQYVDSVYLPAARTVRSRCEVGAKRAIELEAWAKHVGRAWPALSFGSLEVERDGEAWQIRLEVHRGELSPEEIAVELFTEEPQPGVHPMTCQRTEPLCRYIARVPADRPATHYTPRIVLRHADGLGPIEFPAILWQK